jgi:hypothetical protein
VSTGPEHYREAERLLADPGSDLDVARATAHAGLAVAAAVANLTETVRDARAVEPTVVDHDWIEVIT